MTELGPAICSNCGNPWLDAYSVAGKCDACGALAANDVPEEGREENEHGGT